MSLDFVEDKNSLVQAGSGNYNSPSLYSGTPGGLDLGTMTSLTNVDRLEESSTAYINAYKGVLGHPAKPSEPRKSREAGC